jgi:hypothetical protein
MRIRRMIHEKRVAARNKSGWFNRDHARKNQARGDTPGGRP